MKKGSPKVWIKHMNLESTLFSEKDGRLEELILPIERVFVKLPKLKLNEVQTRMYRNGVKLDLSRVYNIKDDIDSYAVYGSDGIFIGTAHPDRENVVLRVGKNLG